MKNLLIGWLWIAVAVLVLLGMVAGLIWVTPLEDHPLRNIFYRYDGCLPECQPAALTALELHEHLTVNPGLFWENYDHYFGGILILGEVMIVDDESVTLRIDRRQGVDYGINLPFLPKDELEAKFQSLKRHTPSYMMDEPFEQGRVSAVRCVEPRKGLGPWPDPIPGPDGCHQILVEHWHWIRQKSHDYVDRRLR